MYFVVFNSLCSAKRDGLCCELLDCVESVSIYVNDLVSVLIIKAAKRQRIAKTARRPRRGKFRQATWPGKQQQRVK